MSSSPSGRFGHAYARQQERVSAALQQFPAATQPLSALRSRPSQAPPPQPPPPPPPHSLSPSSSSSDDDDDDPDLPPWVEDFTDDGTCPCGGALDGGGTAATPPNHYVWLAFLNYDNDEPGYRRAQRNRDYRFIDVNYWTTVLSNSNKFHCQMFFWNQFQREFITFSVDAHSDRVWATTRKTFASGWTFVRLTVSRAQEMVMYNFFLAQLRAAKPFNALGMYALFVRPIDTLEESWFCSQLDVAALQRAGFLVNVAPHATSPAELYRLVMTRAEFATIREETDNPVIARPIMAVIGQRHVSVLEASGAASAAERFPRATTPLSLDK